MALYGGQTRELILPKCGLRCVDTDSDFDFKKYSLTTREGKYIELIFRLKISVSG